MILYRLDFPQYGGHKISVIVVVRRLMVPVFMVRSALLVAKIVAINFLQV